MSHFTTLKTSIRDLDTLALACEELGYELITRSDLKARGYNNQSSLVDAMIKSKSGYDIGFKLDNDSQTYQVVCDWWGAEREFGNSDLFVKKLGIAYAKNAVMKTAKTNRWNLIKSEESEEHITLKFRSWS